MTKRKKTLELMRITQGWKLHERVEEIASILKSCAMHHAPAAMIDIEPDFFKLYAGKVMGQLHEIKESLPTLLDADLAKRLAVAIAGVERSMEECLHRHNQTHHINATMHKNGQAQIREGIYRKPFETAHQTYGTKLIGLADELRALGYVATASTPDATEIWDVFRPLAKIAGFLDCKADRATVESRLHEIGSELQVGTSRQRWRARLSGMDLTYRRRFESKITSPKSPPAIPAGT